MPKCFILCNLNNIKSNYIVSSFAGSNMSYFLGESIPKSFDCVFINVGAPTKKWCFEEKYQVYTIDNYKIVEFSPGLFVLPTRIGVRIMLGEAIRFILKNKNEGDKLIIYHSLSFSKYYKQLLFSFGKNNTIIHVAELYSEAGDVSCSTENEIKLLSNFSKYIFMSDELSRRIVASDKTKKKVMLYGAYRPINSSVKRKNDSLIHVVYSGTSSRVKGGLFTALNASMHLPSNFVFHIYCRADDGLLAEMKKYNVIYEGYVEQQKLNDSISNFDIGLATQNPNLSFNNSSFPSKIANYLSCGLNVVSSKSKSVLESPFSNCVFYYDEDNDGHNCSNAIISASKYIDRINNKKIIEDMNRTAKEQLMYLLEVTV